MQKKFRKLQNLRAKKFGKLVGTRYVLHTKDLEVDGDIVYLPLYMVIFL